MRPILLTPEEQKSIILSSEGLRPSDSPTGSLARRFAGALRSPGSRRYARSPSPFAAALVRVPTRVETTSGVRRPDGRLRRIIKVRRAERLLLEARRFYLFIREKECAACYQAFCC